MPKNRPSILVGSRTVLHLLFHSYLWQCDMVCRGTLTPNRWLMRGSLLSLCLYIVLTGGANSAWATCGDYLHGHMPNHGNGQLQLPADFEQHSNMPARPACSGPHCQQDHQAPAAPTKAV